MFIKGYSEFSISKAGVRGDCIPGTIFGAYFKMDTDVSRLFPYINATFEDAKYFENPKYIQFLLDGIQCTLYPLDVVVAPFNDQDQATKFAKRLIDFLNDLYLKKDSVKPSYKPFRPVPAIDIFKLLPQTNCKDCGYSTCLAFAVALSNRQVKPEQCPGFSSPLYETAVYPVYDKQGKLASTVSIEIDATQMRNNRHNQEKYIAHLEKRLAQEKQQNRNAAESDAVIPYAPLTQREIQVLGLVADGATNTEISDMLTISRHTVKSHVVHIFNKLGVNDRTQAAVWAIRHNII